MAGRLGTASPYDAAGNPIWWKNKSTSGYDSLTWNAEDQLIRLRRYNASNQLQLDATYAYDGLGRRVKKSGSGFSQALYVWNGWELLAETDLSGNATRKYTHHPEGLDFPLAMREGMTTSLFHLDGQGNVYLLTNTSGTRRSEYRYRAWGDRYVTPTGEAVVSPFGYKGREEDRETGLVYMRNRYYSPRLERFLNQDPIGIGGGLNTYVFANNDPANKNDPLGLCPWCGSTYPPQPVSLPSIEAKDDAPIPSAEQGLGGMMYYDFMNSMIYGYDSWDNPLWPRSSVPAKDRGGRRVGPSTPGNKKPSESTKTGPPWSQCMANAAASMGTALVGAALRSAAPMYRGLAAERAAASAVFASWGASVGAYMLEAEALALASTGSTLLVVGGTLIATGAAGLVIGTAIACM